MWWWLSNCTQWSVWVGFLYLLVVRGPIVLWCYSCVKEWNKTIWSYFLSVNIIVLTIFWCIWGSSYVLCAVLQMHHPQTINKGMVMYLCMCVCMCMSIFYVLKYICRSVFVYAGQHVWICRYVWINLYLYSHVCMHATYVCMHGIFICM